VSLKLNRAINSDQPIVTCDTRQTESGSGQAPRVHRPPKSYLFVNQQDGAIMRAFALLLVRDGTTIAFS